MSVLASFFKEANTVAWAACPLLAVAAIVVVDLLTHDASVAAQIFFLFPTLYGASLLRQTGAAVMTGAALTGELVVVAVQLPVREAVLDFGYVAAVLVQLAQVLQARSRKGDVVCRTGGDEIALLLPGCSPSTARRRAEAIMADAALYEAKRSGRNRVTVAPDRTPG